MVFSNCDYYPEGGMNDFIADYDSIHDALHQSFIELQSNDSASIYDSHDMCEVLTLKSFYKVVPKFRLYAHRTLVLEDRT